MEVNMKNALLYALNEVDDVYVLQTIPQKINQNKVNLVKRYRYIATAVAAMLFVCTLINVVNPVFARTLPLVGGAFAFVQDNLDFAGLYTNYANQIGEKASSNGIDVCISEVYCDGINLFVSYEIKSEKPFSEYTNAKILQTQLDYSAKAQLQSHPDLQLDDFGVSGLEGNFIDDYTFAGVETYSLNGKSFPESDTFNISIRSLEVIQENGIGIEIKGRWKFSIPINVNTKDIKTVQVKEISEGHSIDKVIVSPIMLTVYTSYPDIYRGTVNYEVVAFSDISEDDVTIQGQYGATSGVTRIPRNRVGNVLDIYVLDSSVLKKTGIKKYTRENIEPYAIVHKQIELQ